MGRYTGPKHRLARREGINILEKNSPSLDRRLNIPPGIHGKKGRRKISEYGLQLREKQKLKKTYGLLEKQFRNYVMQAQKRKGNTEETLIQLLETRLDNIIYRLGFANSRNQARQFVSHGHVLINGKKVSIPSYMVRKDETITFDPKVMKQQAGKEEAPTLPFVERKGAAGQLSRLPESAEVPNPVDYQLVIEFYSR